MAALPISSIDPEPSLHWVCICKSPFTASAERFAIIFRACGSVRKPFRICGGAAKSGGPAIHLRTIRSKLTPIPGNSVSERPSDRILAASSSYKSALRDARRNAFCNGIFAVSDANASSSAISQLDRKSPATCLGCDYTPSRKHWWQMPERSLRPGDILQSRRDFVGFIELRL